MATNVFAVRRQSFAEKVSINTIFIRKTKWKMSTNLTPTLIFMILNIALFWIVYLFLVKCCGQKTRNPQQRRMYVGSRARPSVAQPEPSIYVSPCNLPPPPKYECMAPPSYEEVVGVHYPSFQPQPITQPITTALAQNAAPETSTHDNVTRSTDNVTRSTDSVTRSNDETVITVPVTRAVAASS